MSPETRYSSTMPASPFALDETRTIVGLMLDSDNRIEIRRNVHDNNFLKVKSLSNEAKLFNYIYNRLESFPDDLKRVIIGSDEADSRYVNFISIMAYDDLFREFAMEMRSRVKEQLKRIQPDGEFEDARFIYHDLETGEAREVLVPECIELNLGQGFE